MKTHQDYLYLPKIILNDALNSGNVINGLAFLTHRYFFVLAQNIDGNTNSQNEMYDSEYVQKFLESPESVDIVSFEAEILSMIPQEMVYSVSDLEMFSVQVGFGFIGGVRLRRKGLKTQSISVGNKNIRKEVKTFYQSIMALK